MIRYNSHTGEGKYKLEVETDNRRYFEMVEEIVRLMIDKELYFKLHEEALAVSLRSETSESRSSKHLICKVEEPVIPTSIDINNSMINPSCTNTLTEVFNNISVLDYITAKNKK